MNKIRQISHEKLTDPDEIHEARIKLSTECYEFANYIQGLLYNLCSLIECGLAINNTRVLVCAGGCIALSFIYSRRCNEQTNEFHTIRTSAEKRLRNYNTLVAGWVAMDTYNVDSDILRSSMEITKISKSIDVIWDKQRIVDHIANTVWFIYAWVYAGPLNIFSLMRMRMVLSALCWYASRFNKMYCTYDSFTKTMQEMTTPILSEAVNMPDGVLTYLMGESGIGKTRLLNDIVRTLPKPSIAFMSQRVRLVVNGMSPVESVLFGMNVQCDHLAYTALKMASMHKADTFIAASGGELQRIMIARVLYLGMTENRKNIILDEPDNNIDAVTFRKIMVRIHKYAQRSNSKVLFTTHKIHALAGVDYVATTIKQLKDKMD